MWHKKIVESIDWEHFLNDVLKLEGEQLKHILNTIKTHAPAVYEGYLKAKPSITGCLARSLRSTGIITSEYIYSPLTLSINEIEWAITHKYVHPRDVVTVKHKSGLSLISKLSNDILMTMLNDESLERDPKLLHYLETERALRNKSTEESFEDFEVKPASNPEFTELKHAAALESKAAKLISELSNTPEPEEEPRPSQIPETLASFRSRGTIGIRTSSNDFNFSNSPVNVDSLRSVHDESDSGESVTAGRVMQLNGATIDFSIARRGIRDVELRTLFTVPPQVRDSHRLWYKVGNRYTSFRICNALAERLSIFNILSVLNSNGFLVVDYPYITQDTNISYRANREAQEQLVSILNTLFSNNSGGE